MTPIWFSDIRPGQRLTLTVRKISPPVLHDSIGLNQSIQVKVLKAMSQVIEVRAMWRNIPTQLVLKSAVDDGIIEIGPPSMARPLVAVTVLVVLLGVLAHWWINS